MILRFSSIGDIVQTTSVLGTLKNKFPKSRIDFMTLSKYSALLQEHPYINNIHEVFEDSYTKERNIVRNITTKSHEKIPTVANPVTFSNYDIQYNRAPPKLGEHTDEILREILGFSDSDINKLRVKHVI